MTDAIHLNTLPADREIVTCRHVVEDERPVGDVYFYLAGQVSMSCAQADCTSDRPEDFYRLPLSQLRGRDETLAGCPPIPPGGGFQRAGPGLPWIACPHETEEASQ